MVDIKDIRQKAKEKTVNFLSETYRIWLPLIASAAIIWWFEELNIRYEGADWLRTLAKIKHLSIGFIFAHVSWSFVFLYVKMWELLLTDRESFRFVILARSGYYSLCVLAASMGL